MTMERIKSLDQLLSENQYKSNNWSALFTLKVYSLESQVSHPSDLGSKIYTPIRQFASENSWKKIGKKT